MKADMPAEGDGKPLPTRRPTGRFPLRRVVSRSAWKLAAVGLFAGVACGIAVAGGHVPSIRSGVYGPGLAALCNAETGRLANAVGGLLLLATGQLAWLIRWARARSLRDFRGGYRVWWWTALAFVSSGVAVLIDAPAAFAATAAWLSGQTVFGSDLLYRCLPGLAAVVLLVPALQGDMRGCRTSRTLLFVACGLWMAGGAAAVAGDQLAEPWVRSGLIVPAAVVPVGLLLAGTTAAFSSLLFHARHVVYESVEPPEAPVRRKKAAAVENEAAEEAEAKPKRAAARRSNRAKVDSEADSKASKVESAKVEPKPAAVETSSKPPRPHFVFKDQVLKDPPKAVPVPKPEPVVAKAPPKPEPPKPSPEPKPVPVAKAAPTELEEETDGDEGMAESDGRQVRLDGPEDPLRGLSKRERRKLRKESKGRDRHGD